MLALLVAVVASAQKPPNAAPGAISGAMSGTAWIPTFSDDFKGSELDLSKWTPHDLAGGTAYAADAAEVKGALHLAGKPGMVTTYGKFAQTYGLFEVRCRMPEAAKGRVWIRLLPIPAGRLPSIEVTHGAGKTVFENHWGTEQTERSYGDAVPVPEMAAGFHVIAIEWERDHVAWLVDGKTRLRSVDGVPQQPMYVSVEVSGDSSAVLDVEYVRVYRRK